MKTKDHLALGRFLLAQCGCGELTRHRRAFLLGCVEPDYDPATYLRGMTARRNLRGHNAENALPYASKCLAELPAKGLRTARDYFLLGTLLHYAADAFTGPHNDFGEKDLLRHAAYERELHGLFPGELRSAAGLRRAAPSSLSGFLTVSHEAYAAAPHGMTTDCRYILDVCERLLEGSLRFAVPAEEAEFHWKESRARAGAGSRGPV